MKKTLFLLCFSLFFNTAYMQKIKEEVPPKQKKCYEKIIECFETIKNTFAEEYTNSSKLEKTAYLLCWTMAIASATIIDDPQKGTALWNFLKNNFPNIKNLLPHTTILAIFQKFVSKALPECGAVSSYIKGLYKQCYKENIFSKCNELNYQQDTINSCLERLYKQCYRENILSKCSALNYALSN